jgi:hypothetical protein
MVLIAEHQGNTRLVPPFALVEQVGLRVGNFVGITSHGETSVYLTIYYVTSIHRKSWRGHSLGSAEWGGLGDKTKVQGSVDTTRWMIVPVFHRIRHDYLRDIIRHEDWAKWVADYPPAQQNPAPPADWGFYRGGNRVAFEPRHIFGMLMPVPVANGGAGRAPLPRLFTMPQHIVSAYFEMAVKCGEVPDCPVCLSPVEKDTIVMTPCGHIFCRACLTTTMEGNRWEGGGKCPQCRAIP